MWLIESYGKVEEVHGHLRCHAAWRDKVLAEMASYGTGFEHKVQPMSALRGEGVTAGVSWLMEAMKKGGRMAVGNPGQAASSW